MILAPQGGGLPFIFPQPSPVRSVYPIGGLERLDPHVGRPYLL